MGEGAGGPVGHLSCVGPVPRWSAGTDSDRPAGERRGDEREKEGGGGQLIQPQTGWLKTTENGQCMTGLFFLRPYDCPSILIVSSQLGSRNPARSS